jgi:DNA-binding response OmpR family regulator
MRRAVTARLPSGVLRAPPPRLMGSLGVVQLFHSNGDALALLGKLLESAGFDVVSTLIPEVRRGHCDVNAKMVQHDPAVVIYDIGPPYEENWARFERLRTTSMRDQRFVITSVNPQQVKQLAGRDERIYEVVDRPFDLDNIVQAVKEATRARWFNHGAAEPHQTPSNVTTMPERRVQADRRQSSWTANDIYAKLREKREAMEFERRCFGRRSTDRDHGPSSHAA